MMAQERIETAFALARVVPVVTIDEPELACDLAEALLAGGLGVMEITLRTKQGLNAIRRVASGVPEMVVGAGTVTTADELARAVDAGARFAMSPGFTRELLDQGHGIRFPSLIPGVATASEALTAASMGYELLKFFPAEAQGGQSFLSSIFGPAPKLRFCPTGGINGSNASAYLSLPNVVCVGGSWLVPANLVEARDWSGLERTVREGLKRLS